MSLLLDLLRQLLEYLGIPVDQGWKHKEYGNTRSIVRLIGTFLPLDPSPRTHFQSVPSGRVREPKQYTTLCRLDIPSLADIPWVLDNEVLPNATFRSPGGTPLTRKDKRRSLNDPASIIALALKKKFAHRHTDDSFDKENRSQEDYAFSSPETPQFGRHLLKPVERRTQKRQILISSVANN
uniref:Mitochondrial fission regulator n=1 Tax=Leptobrachium leishanense TaxID=445787 RepID=A0A8C5QWZ8_9ANUR